MSEKYLQKTELVLSIILAASIPQALNILVNLGNNITWFIFSIIYIIVVIAIIYKVMQKESKGWGGCLKNFSIISFTLLPFLIQKYLGGGEKSSMGFSYIMYYAGFTTSTFFVWGLYDCKKDKKHKKWWNKNGFDLVLISGIAIIVIILILSMNLEVRLFQ
jgi:heme/copper-type cytochrome/quinol oxidase subunit 2